MNCSRVRAQLGDYLEGDLELRTRTQTNEHLSSCASCAAELSELRSTVALLRALPDPATPEGLAEQVIARIHAGEARPSRLPVVVRRVLDPRLAVPLAAGIAGLVLFATGSGPNPNAGNLTEIDRATTPASFRAARIEIWEGGPAMPRLVTARNRLSPRKFEVAGFGVHGSTDADPQNLDLDRQLDRAFHNPMGFVRRVGAIEEAGRRSTVAPLVWLARRRGNAAAVANGLRNTSDPLGLQLAEQFEAPGQRGAVHAAAQRSMKRRRGPVFLPAVPVSHSR